MDGWGGGGGRCMDGWIDGCVVGWIRWKIHGYVSRWKEGRMDG